MATYDMKYLTAGALVRGQVRQIFLEVEKHGGIVTYREHKGFLETTYTHLHMEADDYVIRWAMRALYSLADIRG